MTPDDIRRIEEAVARREDARSLWRTVEQLEAAVRAWQALAESLHDPKTCPGCAWGSPLAANNCFAAGMIKKTKVLYG